MTDGAARLAGGVAEPTRGRLMMAYAIVFVIWGSTYLAISLAIESLPPFLMAGVRFTIAGALLYLWVRMRGAPRPAAAEWRTAAIIGGLLLLGGNGGVVWAQQYVPSGVAALLVATLPIWMALVEWMGPDRRRPTPRVTLGLTLGLVGVVVLVGPGALTGNGNVSLAGAGALILGSMLWAVGSLYSRHAALPATPQLGTAMQMLTGGLLLVLAGLATGEANAVQLEAITTTSVTALLYLIIFGSLVGFSAYIWLLRVEPPSRVATYAYVNPVVAVFLGWLVAGETLNGQTLVAAAIIVGAVALIVSSRRQPAPRPIGPPPSTRETRRSRRRKLSHA